MNPEKRHLPLHESTPRHGHDPESRDVVLDAAAIPHAIRHGAVLGAVDQLRPGASMVLVAPHDPLPLLKQMRERFGETAVDVTYLSREPTEVRLRLTKTTPAA